MPSRRVDAHFLAAVFLGVFLTFLAAGFLVAGFLVGFLAAFLAGDDFLLFFGVFFLGAVFFFGVVVFLAAAGFLAAGFLAAGFLAAGFFATGFLVSTLATLKDPEAPTPLTCTKTPLVTPFLKAALTKLLTLLSSNLYSATMYFRMACFDEPFLSFKAEMPFWTMEMYVNFLSVAISIRIRR